jgi:hypothetical protein
MVLCGETAGMVETAGGREPSVVRLDARGGVGDRPIPVEERVTVPMPVEERVTVPMPVEGWGYYHGTF